MEGLKRIGREVGNILREGRKIRGLFFRLEYSYFDSIGWK